jgi:pyruvate/2-oxoglutarate dehydrogenase complex dihydrolipoamide dehydrogenase (E3) component
MGGDCLNTGCVPSKAFIKAAKVAHTVKNSAKYGVFVSDFKIDFGKVMERMREVRAEISPHDSVYKLAKQYGIDVFLGNATFMNPHEIDVNGRMIQFAK